MPSRVRGGGIRRPRGRALERFEADSMAGKRLRQGGWTPPGCRRPFPPLDRPARGRGRRLSGVARVPASRNRFLAEGAVAAPLPAWACACGLPLAGQALRKRHSSSGNPRERRQEPTPSRPVGASADPGSRSGATPGGDDVQRIGSDFPSWRGTARGAPLLQPRNRAPTRPPESPRAFAGRASQPSPPTPCGLALRPPLG